MKTMKWLLRREFWEHKGSFFWAPVVIGVILALSVGGSLLHTLIDQGPARLLTVNGTDIHSVLGHLPASTLAAARSIVSNNYLSVSAPLFAVLPIVVFFYCLAALYDERRDRSILFWKSLPVSDQMTVLSKVITALCVAPLITIAVASATAFFLLMFGCGVLALYGVNVFGIVLINPNLYLAPVYLISLLPVYILWALPTVGWLLMVSAWARSKVFLWAVGSPLVALALAQWVNYLVNRTTGAQGVVSTLFQNIVQRGLGGLFPGIWLPFEKVPTELLSGEHGMNLAGVVAQSWMTLTGPNVWIGVAAGVAMLFAAMHLRRWREEI
jgi:ABC-2 type transport system permease protein